MYRAQQLAARANIDSLRSDVGERARRFADAEARFRASEAELDRLREGIGDDPDLLEDRRYRWTQTGLRALGAIGLAGLLVGLVPLFHRFFGEPYLTWQGVVNLGFHFRDGDGFAGLASAGAVLMLASPWLVLPWLGAIGLRRQRRWGWALANIGALLYLPTPLMPLSILAMMVLWSGRVRALYFPRDAAVNGTASKTEPSLQG